MTEDRPSNHPREKPRDRELRVLILAPTGRDAAVLSRLLEAEQIPTRSCLDVADLTREIEQGAGLALVANEALPETGRHDLARVLSEQPGWSDLPVILMTTRTSGVAREEAWIEELGPGSPIVLQRPTRQSFLVSTVRAGLRSRARQYQVRDELQRRKEAEEALRISEARMRFAAEATGFGTYDFDVENDRSTWSPQLHALTGVPEDTVLSGGFFDGLIHPDDFPAFDRTRRALLKADVEGWHEMEYRIVRPDGEVRWVRDAGRTLYDGQGEQRRPRRVLGTVQDITKRREAEERLKLSLRDKDNLLSKLEEVQEEMVRTERLATLGQLAGGVAHELRTPLGVIRNAVYYLEATADPGDREMRDVLGELQRSVLSSDQIIGEMLDYVREPSRDKTSFVLREAIDRALTMIDVPRTVDLERPGTGEAIEVRANAEQVARVLLNLLSNAIHAMPDGGRISVRASGDHGEPFIEVRDTGHGIEPENLQRVFDPLYTTKTRGIGLGLAISKRYAEVNGGRLEAESAPGQGSVFRLVLKTA